MKMDILLCTQYVQELKLNQKKDSTATKTPEDYVKTTQVLLDFNADVNLLEYCTPLHIAVLGGKHSLPLVQLWIQYGADPTMENSQGWNSLHCAINIEDKAPEIVDYLKEVIRKSYPTFFDTFDEHVKKTFSF